MTETPHEVRPPREWLARGLGRYLERLAARRFAAVWWHRPVDWDPEPPTIYVANHTNWWDGFLAYLTGRRLSRVFHVLMEEEQLARYGFFRRVGALPLDRRSAARAYAQLDMAARTLMPGRGLWVFPQGARRSWREPVAAIERGAAQVALLAAGSVRICPVAFRYEYTSEDRPEAFVLVGDRVPGIGDRESGVSRVSRDERIALSERIERMLAGTVAALDHLLERENLAGFEVMVPGRFSMNKRLDRLRHWLGLLPGEFEARNG